MFEAHHANSLYKGMEALPRDGTRDDRAARSSCRQWDAPLVRCQFSLGGGAMQTINVLVIEDSKVHVKMIRGMLKYTKGAAFAVEVYHQLSTGLGRLAEDDAEIDVILLDLTLPDSEGIESAKIVAQRAPDLPIVVLTSTDDEEVAIQAMQCGAEDYLVKGQIDGQLLARSLRYAIERKRGELALQRAHDDLELRVEQRTAQLRQMQEAARRQQEELAHASRLNTLGEMASGLAHELNQPLMAIVGFADGCLQLLAAEKFDRERFAEILRDTSSEAKRAGEIIKRLRKLVSKRPSQITAVDVNDLIRETITLLGKNLCATVQLDLDETLPKVMADRIQIQQVLLNLANNAAQAMESANSEVREIHFCTWRVDKTVHVEVRDTGPGLSNERFQRLFQPFFTSKPDGLGLGLSISRSIIESHSGRLTAQQNSDRGLTFRFSLPSKSNGQPDNSVMQ